MQPSHSEASQSESEQAKRKPIRRGNACSFCRRRKMRCNGELPTCSNCLKSNRVCSYEGLPKTSDRVHALEAKIRELESALTASSNGSPTPPVASSSHSTTLRRPASGKRPSTDPYPSRNDSRSAAPADHPADDQQAFSRLVQDLFGVEPQPLPTLDSPLRSATSPAAADPLQSSSERQAFPASPLLPPSASSEFAFSLSDFPSELWPAPYEAPLPFNDRQPTPPAGVVVPAAASSRSISTAGSLGRSRYAPPPWSGPNTTGSSCGGKARPSRPLDGLPLPLNNDWGDGTQIPRPLRDHLLRNFFARRQQFGLCHSPPRFLASLDSPFLEERPHPSLVFAVYTVGARFSDDPHVAELETVLFDRAKREVELAPEDTTRAYQAVQANTILSISLYSKNKVQEGWLLASNGVRLATSLRLHRIYSGDFSRLYLSFAGKDLPQQPPADATELGIMIWAFWSAWITERCGGITLSVLEAIDAVQIATPFPRPLEEYEQSFILQTDCRTMRALLAGQSFEAGGVADSLGTVLIKAHAMLSEVDKLHDRYMVPSLHQSFANDISAGRVPRRSDGSDIDRAARGLKDDPFPQSPPRPPPSEHLSVLKALDSLVSFLPVLWCDPSTWTPGGLPTLGEPSANPGELFDLGGWDTGCLPKRPGVSSPLFTLHTIIHTAYALLFDEMSEYDPAKYRPFAVFEAQAVVQLISVIANVDFSLLDIFISVCWKMMAPILLRHTARLKQQGDPRYTAIERDIDILLLALRRFGVVYRLGSSQADLLEAMRGMML